MYRLGPFRRLLKLCLSTPASAIMSSLQPFRYRRKGSDAFEVRAERGSRVSAQDHVTRRSLGPLPNNTTRRVVGLAALPAWTRRRVARAGGDAPLFGLKPQRRYRLQTSPHTLFPSTPLSNSSMDGHLTALSSTLGSIAHLQRQLLHEPKSHPFTTAILAPKDTSPYAKPAKTFIRESDSVERRLFYFPPVGGMLDDPSANGQQHHYGKNERDVEEEAADIASELLPRKPEVKSVPMPTPLRPTAGTRRAGSGEAARKEYDTRALLIAAQRLSENYNRQPRQRKHIRALLKKTAELRDQTHVNSQRAMRFEAVLTRITNGEDPQNIEELPALLSGAGPDGVGAEDLEEQRKKQRRIQELKEKAQRVKDELNREEMEVLALEEMREDLLKKVSRRPTGPPRVLYATFC